MKKSSLILLFAAYIIGIILADTFHFQWVISFTLWSLFVLVFIILHYFGAKKIAFKPWITCSILLIFLSSGTVNYTLKLPQNYSNEFSAHFLLKDQLVGEVIDYQKGKGDYDKAIIAVDQVIKPHKSLNVKGKLLCYVKSQDHDLFEGAVIQFQPNLQRIKNKNNPGEFNAERYWEIRGIQQMSFINDNQIIRLGETVTFKRFWTNSRNYLKSVIQNRVSPKNQGLMIALVLGDKSDLKAESRSQFANAGAMHVLAVSGMHVGILLGILTFLFKHIKPFRKRNLYLYVSLAILWAYAFLTGLPASVFRAVMMFTILGIGQIAGRRLFSLFNIFASALILLIIDPTLLFNIGFQLSYLAVLSIGIFYQPIRNLYQSKYLIPRKLWEGIAIGFAAQIGTVPISLYYFNQFPNYFLLSNIGILLIASAAMISVLALLVFHWVPLLSDIFVYISEYIFSIFNGFIEWINTLPGVISIGFSPSLTLVSLIYIGIILSWFFWKRQNIKYFIINLSALFICLVSLIISREINKSKKELVFINHYENVMFIKENRKLWVIHNEHLSNVKSLEYLIKGYEGKAGIMAKVTPIKRNESLIISDDIQVTSTKDRINLSYYGQNYILPTKQRLTTLRKEDIIIKGDWNTFFPKDKAQISTSDKAYVVNNNP